MLAWGHCLTTRYCPGGTQTQRQSPTQQLPCSPPPQGLRRHKPLCPVPAPAPPQPAPTPTPAPPVPMPGPPSEPARPSRTPQQQAVCRGSAEQAVGVGEAAAQAQALAAQVRAGAEGALAAEAALILEATSARVLEAELRLAEAELRLEVGGSGGRQLAGNAWQLAGGERCAACAGRRSFSRFALGAELCRRRCACSPRGQPHPAIPPRPAPPCPAPCIPMLRRRSCASRR